MYNILSLNNYTTHIRCESIIIIIMSLCHLYLPFICNGSLDPGSKQNDGPKRNLTFTKFLKQIKRVSHSNPNSDSRKMFLIKRDKSRRLDSQPTSRIRISLVEPASLVATHSYSPPSTSWVPRIVSSPKGVIWMNDSSWSWKQKSKSHNVPQFSSLNTKKYPILYTPSPDKKHNFSL